MNYNIDDYPAVKDYLLSFGMEKLEQTGKEYIIDGVKVKARKKTNNKWFETQDSISYWDDFSKQKIVWKRIGSILKFSYDESGCLGLDSTCFATGENIKFLSAVLNTHTGNYLFKDSPKTGTGDLLISVQAMEPVKIPLPSTDTINKVNEILDDIICSLNTGNNISDKESELENIVRGFYGFTDEEYEFIVQTVENNYRQHQELRSIKAISSSEKP